MIYGYMKSTSNVVESVEATKSEELVSIVYNEYCNYKEMLESCTDESAKPILEAQVKVLREVGIKDIITKIKEAFEKLFKKISEIIARIKKFISEKLRNVSETIRKAKDNLKIIEKLDSKIKIIFESSNFESKLSGIFSTVASNKYLYFSADDILSTINGSIICDAMDDAIKDIYNVIDGKPIDTRYTETVFGGKIDFAHRMSKRVVVSNRFNKDYLIPADLNFDEAANKYMNDKMNKHELNSISKIYRRCLEIIKDFKYYSEDISDTLNKLELYKPKMDRAFDNLVSAMEKDNISGDEKTFITGIRALTNVVSLNVKICNQVSIILDSQYTLADSTVKRADLLLDKIGID